MFLKVTTMAVCISKKLPGS